MVSGQNKIKQTKCHSAKNRTQCHRIFMQQNCNNECYKGVTWI